VKEFLDKLFNKFPDFSPDWDMDEFSYIFFGDFARFVIERHDSIDMESVNYIINLFLASSFQLGDKENIIIVGFLEVLHDDINTYNKLKENSNNELKEIFNKYLNDW
jgi:hypothetical protein